MSNRIARTLVATLILLGSRGLTHARQIGGAQNCNGKKVEHTAPAGTETGTGGTEWQALKDAGSNAWHEVSLTLPPCANCPSGGECPHHGTLRWDNYEVGIPYYDPLLELWTVSCSWDCCDLSQTCEPCQ